MSVTQHWNPRDILCGHSAEAGQKIFVQIGETEGGRWVYETWNMAVEIRTKLSHSKMILIYLFTNTALQAEHISGKDVVNFGENILTSDSYKSSDYKEEPMYAGRLSKSFHDVLCLVWCDLILLAWSGITSSIHFEFLVHYWLMAFTDNDEAEDNQGYGDNSGHLAPEGGASKLRRRMSLRPGANPRPSRPRRPSVGQGQPQIQLLSIPQLDAIQRSLKLLDVRLQHVQSNAKNDEKTRDDVEHIRRVMSENQKALSTVVTVLASIQEEVRTLSVNMHRQQATTFQIQPPPQQPRKKSNDSRSAGDKEKETASKPRDMDTSVVWCWCSGLLLPWLISCYGNSTARDTPPWRLYLPSTGYAKQEEGSQWCYNPNVKQMMKNGSNVILYTYKRMPIIIIVMCSEYLIIHYSSSASHHNLCMTHILTFITHRQ